ncbi:luciferase domain-containing protein [Pseudonocardia bannensis]|uniref:luciferase domain-containing protein n=1 Tax=Pseudonocardia bannensis TaxID=630973 RepID=UPI001B7D10BB|nr:luciferase family protein [Pseudonocardia bannensis]
MNAPMEAVPTRDGPRPAVSDGMPHRQIDQQSPTEVAADLVRRVFDALPPGVHAAPSRISVPGARALVLDDDVIAGPPAAFLIGREYAHVHPAPDHSLHLTLPPDAADRVVAAGWAEPHPAVTSGHAPAGAVMVYAPRTTAEVDVVLGLLDLSYRHATTPEPEVAP